MGVSIRRRSLLERLERVTYQPKPEEGDTEMDRTRLDSAVLHLARIDHDTEYLLCRAVAQHLMGSIPEPDDTELPADPAEEV
jgi:hypothetical protein